MTIKINAKGQAVAPMSQSMCQEQLKSDETAIYWLGGGGAMIHTPYTTIMLDPVLEGFDLPLLYEVPLKCEDIEHLDGILITHIDNDHYSKVTCQKLKDKATCFYAPNYVAEVMDNAGLPVKRVDIEDVFKINDLTITVTRALHNWQNGSKKWNYRYWEEKDYCGYEIETEAGVIWMPGDSKLLPCQLERRAPDVILFDFTDNEWHITLEGAIRLANAYPEADLICIHWGSVDAPDMSPFNGNPMNLMDSITNPSRIKVLAPGEKYVLRGVKGE